GMPRALALKHVVDKYGVNFMCTICAQDKAAFPILMEYWKLPVEIGGMMELVGNALVMRGEKERTVDLRGNPLPGRGEE
ncbi:MAG: (Fe-S)-binding protein, partial [Archaeoglobales archaeon]